MGDQIIEEEFEEANKLITKNNIDIDPEKNKVKDLMEQSSQIIVQDLDDNTPVNEK